MDEVELCTWIDFSLTDIEGFLTFSCNREGLKNELRRKLGLKTVDSAKQDMIELDMYIYAFLFGLRQEFSAGQLSTLLGIVKRLHAKCVSTVFDNQSDCLQYFRQMMVQHSVRRPPFSVCIFCPNQVKKINEYILTTYFKHFKLYKYAFTKKVRLNIALSYAGQDGHPEQEVDEESTSPNDENTAEKEDKESKSCLHIVFECMLVIYISGLNENMGEEELETEPASSHIKELINCGLSKIVQQEKVRPLKLCHEVL